MAVRRIAANTTACWRSLSLRATAGPPSNPEHQDPEDPDDDDHRPDIEEGAEHRPHRHRHPQKSDQLATGAWGKPDCVGHDGRPQDIIHRGWHVGPSEP